MICDFGFELSNACSSFKNAFFCRVVYNIIFVVWSIKLLLPKSIYIIRKFAKDFIFKMSIRRISNPIWVKCDWTPKKYIYSHICYVAIIPHIWKSLKFQNGFLKFNKFSLIGNERKRRISPCMFQVVASLYQRKLVIIGTIPTLAQTLLYKHIFCHIISRRNTTGIYQCIIFTIF